MYRSPCPELADGSGAGLVSNSPLVVGSILLMSLSRCAACAARSILGFSASTEAALGGAEAGGSGLGVAPLGVNGP